MKIYLASSWKNKEKVRELAESLRAALGFIEVDDFTDPSLGRFVFSWDELEDEYKNIPGKVVPSSSYANAIKFLEDDRAQKAFVEDVSRIDWADVLILILPCGKSAHMELGYAAANGKKIIVYAPDGFKREDCEVMYGFADLLTYSLCEVSQQLSNWEMWESINHV